MEQKEQKTFSDGFVMQAIIKNLPKARWARLSQQKIGRFEGISGGPSVRLTEMALVHYKKKTWYLLFGQEQRIEDDSLSEAGQHCIVVVPAFDSNPFETRKSPTSESEEEPEIDVSRKKRNPLGIVIKDDVETILKKLPEEPGKDALLISFTEEGPLFFGRNGMEEKARRLTELRRESPAAPKATAHTRAEHMIDKLFLVL